MKAICLKLLLWVLVFLDTSFSNAQNKATQDSIEVNKLFDLSDYYYFENRNIDSIISIATKAILLSENNNFLSKACKADSHLGNGYLLDKKLDSALFYANKSYKLAKKLKNLDLEFSALLLLNSYYIESNDLVKAMDYSIEAVKIAEKKNNQDKLANAYYKLGYTFARHDDDEKHKYYLNKAYKIIQDKNATISVNVRSPIYTSMVDYFERKRFKNPNDKTLKDSVLYYTEKGIEYGKSVNRTSLIVYLLGTKGKMFFIDDNLKDAKKYYNEALTYRGKMDNTNLLNLFNKLAYVNLKENNIKQALIYKDSILLNVSEEPSYYRQGERFYLAYYICKTAKRNDLALQYHESMTKKFDKAKEEKQIKSLNELEIKYETEKKEAQIITQKLENETIKRKAMTNYFVFGLIGLLSIGFLGLMYFKNKNKSLSSELNLAKTKAALHRSQLNPHFISNSINTIYPFLFDKSDPNKATAYLADLSHMIRSILDSTFETNWTINEEINFITQYCNIQELKMDIPLNLEITCDESLGEVAVPSLITQTFIENCFVHGFANKKKPATINMEISKEVYGIQIKIVDNGNINEKPGHNHKSRSNQIVRQRIINTYSQKQLQKDFLTYGKINNRFQVLIKLPINS